VIYAFALEPSLVATWARRDEFRFFFDKFGIGTPRVMFELPAFTEWKNAVHAAALELGISDQDELRLVELFRVLGEVRCSRHDALYDPVKKTWLENAETEYARRPNQPNAARRRPFQGILASSNPRNHAAVLIGGTVETDPRWQLPHGVAPERKPRPLTEALSGLLVNCQELHLVEPHFGAENARHRNVLVEMLGAIGAARSQPRLIRVHCRTKAEATFFRNEIAAQLPHRVPKGITVEFQRWSERGGGEEIHNRYVLTDIGGVTLGKGLDEGQVGQFDDVTLMSPEQYRLRWEQWVGKRDAFKAEEGGPPQPVVGTKTIASATRARR
jgi:hypothetical protein